MIVAFSDNKDPITLSSSPLRTTQDVTADSTFRIPEQKSVNQIAINLIEMPGLNENTGVEIETAGDAVGVQQQEELKSVNESRATPETLISQMTNDHCVADTNENSDRCSITANFSANKQADNFRTFASFNHDGDCLQSRVGSASTRTLDNDNNNGNKIYNHDEQQEANDSEHDSGENLFGGRSSSRCASGVGDYGDEQTGMAAALSGGSRRKQSRPTRNPGKQVC